MITENQVKNYLRSKDKDYVNKLIESLYEQDDEDIIMIRTKTFCIQCPKIQLVHDEDFINMKLKDKIVTHLGVNHFNSENGILIKCV